MKKIFKQGCSQEELKSRNVLLIVAKIVVWGIFIFLFAKPSIQYLVVLENPPLVDWLFAAISLILAFRFEIWAMPFRAEWRYAYGRDWSVNGLKDRPVFQRKFFTGKMHSENDLNPLW